MMKRKGSITVLATFVFFMIFVLMLVTLEHAYVVSGRTLAFQIFNKSLESVLGNYYAPLYAEYGLFGIPLGEDFEAYADKQAIEAAVAETFNQVFSHTEEDDGNALWDFSMMEADLKNVVFMTSESGEVYMEQVSDEVMYSGITYLTNELLSAKEEGAFEALSDLKTLEEDSKENSQDKAEDDEDESEEDEDAGFSDVWDTLTAFLCDGFNGLWFEDTSELSDKEVDLNDLPSDDYEFGLYGSGDKLFEELELSEELISSGDYVDSLISGDFLEDFEDTLGALGETTSEKAVLAAYAGVKMDSFLRDNFSNGALDYEQEYLVFGASKDETNLKRMAWAIFGVRLAFSLVCIMRSAELQAQVAEFTAILEVVPPLAAALNILISVVWAVENAIVETAALLKGKTVDLLTNAGNLSVGFENVFCFTKGFIKDKAEAYAPVSAGKLPYQGYLTVFTFMTNKEKLIYRQMDIIELNIKGKYNANFSMGNLVTGFSCEGLVKARNGFVTVRNGDYFVETDSAVFIR